jgi:hypothetical protein
MNRYLVCWLKKKAPNDIPQTAIIITGITESITSKNTKKFFL